MKIAKSSRLTGGSVISRSDTFREQSLALCSALPGQLAISPPAKPYPLTFTFA
jgi:hypothetical protein